MAECLFVPKIVDKVASDEEPGYRKHVASRAAEPPSRQGSRRGNEEAS